MADPNRNDWPTTTRTVEKMEQEKNELAEGKPTPMANAARERIKKEKKADAAKAKGKRTYTKRGTGGKSKKEKGPKKSEFADDFVPYPDTGHDMEQLLSWGEDKQKAVLGKNWPDFKKKYLKK